MSTESPIPPTFLLIEIELNGVGENCEDQDLKPNEIA